MKVSISLGGSLLTKDMNPENYRKYANVLRELKERGHQIIVVCGGGKPAREWIGLARKLGADARTQDRLGIHATHLNALLLIAALGPDAHPHIHRRGSEIKRNLGDRILVGGGHLPGSSTDYRAVLFAEAAGADLVVNATDVDGVYDKDPEKHADAVKLEKTTYTRLEEIIIENTKQTPGEYALFDLKAVRRLKKTGIPLIIVDGTDPEEIKRAVEGHHGGTEIRFSLTRN
jgi:uridylate kinase